MDTKIGITLNMKISPVLIVSICQGWFNAFFKLDGVISFGVEAGSTCSDNRRNDALGFKQDELAPFSNNLSISSLERENNVVVSLSTTDTDSESRNHAVQSTRQSQSNLEISISLDSRAYVWVRVDFELFGASVMTFTTDVFTIFTSLAELGLDAPVYLYRRCFASDVPMEKVPYMVQRFINSETGAVLDVSTMVKSYHICFKSVSFRHSATDLKRSFFT